MKVLHLRASNFYGGPERQIHLHARAAAARGLDIEVASFREPVGVPEFLTPIAADGIAVHTLEVRNAYDASAIARLRSLLLRERIDLVCTHDYRSNAIAWLARRNTPVAWIAFSRGSTRENLKVRAFHAFDRFLVRRADHIVAVAEAQRGKLIAQGIRPASISVVANAIDVDRVNAIAAVDLRARFGFSGDELLCVAGGRFSAEKGQLDLVRAADRALLQLPSLRLLLFGDGPDLEGARKLIQSLGRQKEIRCPGFEKDMLGCIRGADLLINPSHSEGLPNIVLEAMASGTPVLATAVGGVPDLLEQGAGGFLVPPADVERLAQALVGVALDPEQRRERAARALRVIRSEYGFDRQFERLADLYGRVVDGRPGSDALRRRTTGHP